MDFFKEYNWHSSLEVDNNLRGRRIVRRLTATKKNINRFLRLSSDSNFLIHKSSKELWRFSDDGDSIVPVFPDDILTEDDL